MIRKRTQSLLVEEIRFSVLKIVTHSISSFSMVLQLKSNSGLLKRFLQPHDYSIPSVSYIELWVSIDQPISFMAYPLFCSRAPEQCRFSY